MQIDVKEVIKRVEVRLAEIGMSKSEFYRKSGISSASFSQWNTGVNSPSMKKLKNASDCLGVSLDYLLTGEQKEKPAPQRDGLKEIYAIFEQLTPSRQAKLIELARLYLDDQRRNEETQ